MPAIAPVVTPWARAGLIDIEDNAAAAPRAQLNRTNQRMGGPPRRGSKIGIVVPIETGRKCSGPATTSRTLGGRFTQQIHGCDTDENVRRPGRQLGQS